jgi:VanZ family protein
MLSTLPWLLPGTLVAFVLSGLLSPAVARALRVRRVVAWALLLSFGVIIAATLTPLRGAFAGDVGSGICDLSRWGPASVEELHADRDAVLNMLIFVPFGMAIGLTPQSRRKASIVALAIALPFAIEAIQLLMPALARGCQSADVADNLVGLVVGVAAGAFVGRIVPKVRQPDETSMSPASD